MPNTHHQIRMARKLEQALERHQAEPANALQSTICEIQQNARLLKASFKKFRLAREHGWSTAVAGVENVILIRVRELYEVASRALNDTRSTTRYPKPTLRDLYGELQQLEQEFPSSELELRAGIISVETPSIELEGVYLGSCHGAHRLRDIRNLLKRSEPPTRQQQFEFVAEHPLIRSLADYSKLVHTAFENTPLYKETLL